MRRDGRATRPHDMVVGLGICMAITGWIAGSPAQAVPVPPLTKIADTNTLVPGGSGGSFTTLEAPVIENSIVAFGGENTDMGEQGVYYGNDELSLQALVDRNTLLPGSSETFGLIAGLNGGGGPSISGLQIVFRASSDLFTPDLFVLNGLYVGTLFTRGIKIVVENTFDPPVTFPLTLAAVFLDFYNPSFEGGDVAYRGDTVDINVDNGLRRSGIFLTRQDVMTPELIFDPKFALDSNQIGDAVSLAEPSLTGGEIVFAAFNFLTGFESQYGVYRTQGDAFAAEVTALPGSATTGDFTRIGGATTAMRGRPIADGDQVLFSAWRSGFGTDPGLFFIDDLGMTHEVATLDTPIPNGSGNFTSLPFDSWALEGDRVLFVGTGATGQIGIYEWMPDGTPDGSLVEWLSNNSTGNLEPGRLAGERPANTLRGLRIVTEGLDDGLVAFGAFFNDGSSAIYRTGPKPGTTPDVPIIPFTTGVAGRFDFPEIDVVRDGLLFFDPHVAIGYDFEVVSGPGVSSLALPLDIGDGVYEIWVWDGEMYVLDGLTVEEGDFATHLFDSATTRFRILGIEMSAGLDAEDPLVFPAGLVFAADGAVDVSMTVLVPEPDPAVACAAALLCLAALSRRAARRNAAGRTSYGFDGGSRGWRLPSIVSSFSAW